MKYKVKYSRFKALKTIEEEKGDLDTTLTVEEYEKHIETERISTFRKYILKLDPEREYVTKVIQLSRGKGVVHFGNLRESIELEIEQLKQMVNNNKITSLDGYIDQINSIKNAVIKCIGSSRLTQLNKALAEIDRIKIKIN